MNQIFLSRELKKVASLQRAEAARRYFKTGPGEYGEGDRFLGVSVPEIRRIAKQSLETPLKEVGKLLRRPLHEERLLAAVLLVEGYRRSRVQERRRELAEFYDEHRVGVNNWDLVDISAPTPMGAYCLESGGLGRMSTLLQSSRHWDRRIAIVGTLAYIRSGDNGPTWDFARRLLDDDEDLMHKATGWMLREAGKRDLEGLRRFLKKHGTWMPRTMLRYAIERLPEAERKKILFATRRV